MSWNLDKIKNECESLSKSKNDVFSISIELNGRLKKTLGRVFFGQKPTGEFYAKKMEFSKSFLEAATDEEIKQVIAHEWCHYYLLKSTKQNHGHDNVFNTLAREMGGNEGCYINLEKASNNYKYSVRCSECGEDLGGYYRAGFVVKNPEKCFCRKCNGKIEVIQNY